jgi:hypothetical protein
MDMEERRRGLLYRIIPEFTWGDYIKLREPIKITNQVPTIRTADLQDT